MDFVTTMNCDKCDKRCTGVMQHNSSGVRVSFVCKICDYPGYQRVSDDEKDKWLQGESINV